MIPKFPKFKKLELSDRIELESITKKFPPYSDFNFVSLWSWDTKNDVELSQLRDNLIIKFSDYISGNFFYSFLGKNKNENTAFDLISYAKKIGIDTTLRLIPEEVIKSDNFSDQYIIAEDRDNFDYILSVGDLIKLKGSRLRGKKNFINRFKRMYESVSRHSHIDLNDKNIKEKIISLFYKWEKSRGKTKQETKNELNAVHKLLSKAHLLDLITIGIFINDELVGFSINELVQDNHGVIHFEKADISYIGVFQYLKHQTAIYLNLEGSEYINYEQDLGIEGLRKAKLSHGPTNFLKKYTISLKK